MCKSFSLFILVALTSVSSYSQTNNQAINLAGYNVGFGGFSAGMGAIINKDKGTNWKKAFIKGFWQGSIGGLINYAGKRTLFCITSTNEKIFAWPAKLLHSAGVSIMENASLHEPFLQNWNIDYGPLRFDFSFNKKKRFTARFLPEVIYAIIYADKSASFDFKNTLLTGNLLFTNKEKILINVGGRELEGFSFGRAIAVGKDWVGLNKVIAHEIVHQFQYGEYQVFNTWLKPLYKKVKSKPLTCMFTKHVYADIPYFWLPYAMERIKGSEGYLKNFFEFEAERFATNAYIKR